MSIPFDTWDETAPALSLGVHVVPDRDGRRSAPLTFTNVSALPRIQRIAERWGIVPTYLVPFVALGHRELVARLSDWSAAGRAEIGARLDGRDEDELERLTRALPDVLGVRPVTLAIEPRTAVDAQQVRDLGYRVVTGVAPDQYLSTAGLRVAPVTAHGGTTRRALSALAPWARGVPRLDVTAETGARLDAVLSWLTGRLLDQVHVVATSRELCVGCGPRAGSAAEVEQSYRRLERVLRRATEELGARPRPLCESVLVPTAALRTRVARRGSRRAHAV